MSDAGLSPAAGSRGNALIVAHGQPSDPGPAAADLAALAVRVAALLPGWEVQSATLAEGDGFAAVARGMAPGLIYPMFMAGGWFTRVQIPQRLAVAGIAGWTVLEPFGCDPALHDLVVTLVAEAAVQEVILAAHGSFKSSVPSDVARHVAARIAAEVPIARAVPAYIDQSPQLATTTGFGPGSLCLPFFAAMGGHVTDDIPKALTEAGFQGRILPPVGLDHRVPALIAAAILRGQPVCADRCRWQRG